MHYCIISNKQNKDIQTQLNFSYNNCRILLKYNMYLILYATIVITINTTILLPILLYIIQYGLFLNQIKT